MINHKLSEISSRLWDLVLGRFKVAYLPFTGDYIGLGNRIKAICDFYVIGYRRFIVYWEADGWVTDSWKNLFELDGCGVLEFSNKAWGGGGAGKIFLQTVCARRDSG